MFLSFVYEGSNVTTSIITYRIQYAIIPTHTTNREWTHESNFDIESDDQMTVLWYVEVYTIHPSVGEWRDMGYEWYEEDDADTWVRDVCTQQIRFGYANLTVFRVRARGMTQYIIENMYIAYVELPMPIPEWRQVGERGIFPTYAAAQNRIGDLIDRNRYRRVHSMWLFRIVERE